ncbi:TetR-like C-terminal domain-containing protein [Tsukamurella sp. NPDC003166]|uniref:TetR-like C-terminal domain-containing protein n=1 Tax=Tsukamurella sp. NPDC003166 TaxID=3154444 RepID=UPI0033B7B93A
MHYSSIYRNWTDRGVLLRDALLDLVAGVVPVPDTGDLEADLLELTDGVLDLYQTPVGRILLSTTRSAEEALVDFHSAYWDLRLEALSAIIDRAVECVRCRRPATVG